MMIRKRWHFQTMYKMLLIELADADQLLPAAARGQRLAAAGHGVGGGAVEQRGAGRAVERCVGGDHGVPLVGPVRP